jgi:hypothetical protein
MTKHTLSRSKDQTSSATWSTTLIYFVVRVSLSLWKFRNGVLYGQSVDVMEANERGRLSQEIKAAYKAYHLEHFIILNSFCHLFTSKSLKQRLNQDHDSLQCWHGCMMKQWRLNDSKGIQPKMLRDCQEILYTTHIVQTTSKSRQICTR